MQYDVIVVGAGPAGSIAAHECVVRGLDTLLLEKHVLPRDKPCGGAVMFRGLRMLKGELPKSVVERCIYGLRFVLPHHETAEFISDKMIGITVFRSQFDEFLARRAERSGVELQENARVTGVAVSDKHAEVILEDDSLLRSRFIIGADGVNSVVSRSLGLRPKRKDLTKMGLGMEADFHVGEDSVLHAMRGDASVLEVIPAEDRISYGWVFPKRAHLAIGVAGAGYQMRSLRPTFERFVKSLENRTGLVLVPEVRRTHFLGGDGLGSKNVASRAILVGDAAGFVDPMMGEGIAYAMRSGFFAAETIEFAMALDRHDEEVLAEYQRKCVGEFSADFTMAGWAGSKGASFAESILPKASGHKLACDVMAMVARGEIGYADIPSYVVRMLPRSLPRIIRQVIQSRVNASS
ncbi:geranylgeranyl reductase family protein [Candidatus Thorarchaeota archaeon]|jgi:geranylgeranyl reductase family protein|nr:MAG: geranylgeranyl reductase family protein [Candidatus Thorarchaeota archaeon]